MMYSAAVALVLFAAAELAHGHPNWARNKTLLCTTQEPGHRTSPQSDTTFKDFYALSGTSAVEGGVGIYNVKIEAVQKDFGIAGYLVVARDACTGEILSGNWSTAQADQILNCNPNVNGLTAVHHRPRKAPAVPSVTHTWVPTNGTPNSLSFTATVVNKKDTYWVKQLVPVVPCKEKN